MSRMQSFDEFEDVGVTDVEVEGILGDEKPRDGTKEENEWPQGNWRQQRIWVFYEQATQRVAHAGKCGTTRRFRIGWPCGDWPAR